MISAVTFAWLLVYAGAALLSFFSWVVVYQLTYWRRRKVPHPRLTPVIGNNSPLLFRTESFASHAQNLYGDFPGARYYGMMNFTTPVIFVKHLDLVRDICIKSFEDFAAHQAFVSEEMDPIAGRNIFTLSGQKWRELRNTLSPSYTASRMKYLFELIDECAKEFVRHFVEHPEAREEFECRTAFTSYTNDVIATAAFGVKVNSMKEPDNEFFAHGKIATSFASLSWFLKIVLMRTFARPMRLAGATFLPRSADRFLKRVILDTVRVRLERNIVRPDMLQLLIQAMKEKDSRVSMNDLIGQAFIFYLAGFDTASGLMSFLVHELAVNEEVQDKLRREIDESFGDVGSSFNYDSLAELRYLDMVIRETLRLYPPVPMTNRICVKDHKLEAAMDGYSGFVLEKDSLVLIPIFALHRDPKIYPEPERFIPERFSDKNKGNIDTGAYLPFGIGPRKCIGNRFAIMETKIAIVHLMRKFVIKRTGKTTYPVTFSKEVGFNLKSEAGLWVRFEERKKND